MTQYEAEGLISVLKRRQAEEKTAVEESYELERHRLDADKKHSVARIESHIREAQKKLIEAKDATYWAKGKPEWKEKALAERAVSDTLKGYYEELSEVRKWYKDEFRRLLDKRDQDFRKIITGYANERERIMSQVVYPDKEESVSYWKSKYYLLKAEVEKRKEDAA